MVISPEASKQVKASKREGRGRERRRLQEREESRACVSENNEE